MDIKEMREPWLIVMAAGMGSRYGGLKQIDPISEAGEIIMDFSLYDAMLAGFQRVCFVIRPEMEEAFRGLIDHRCGKYMQVEYAFQELEDLPQGYTVPKERVKPWGTAHAIYACRHIVDGPFAVINADDYYGQTGFQLMYDFLARNGEEGHFCMIAYQLKKTVTANGSVARGVCTVSKDGYLQHIVERTQIAQREEDIAFTEDDGATWQPLLSDAPVSMNFWGYTPLMARELEKRFPDFLDKALADNPLKGEYQIPTVTDALVKDGLADVRVLLSRDRWYGVTYKEDKEGVVSALQSMKDKGLYPEKLWR